MVSTGGSTSTAAEGSTAAPGSTGVDSTDADSSSSAASSSGTTGDVEFELSSPAFEPDGPFPGSMHIQGGNVHPELNWVGAPGDAMSFGIFFHDETISFEHSAIWNIDAAETGVPEGVDPAPMPGNVPGAVQCRNWTDNFGYGGPGSPANFYTFTLYALDIADLSGEIDQDSNLGEVRMALEAHSIEQVTLTGQSSGPG